MNEVFAAELAGIVKGYVDRQLSGVLASVNERLITLEVCKPEPGPQGPAGPQGEAGPAGECGTAGSNGLDGKDGLPGADGKDGANGLDGKDGAPGQDALDEVPDSLCEKISKAMRMIAETPALYEGAVPYPISAQTPPVNVHLPEIKMPEIRFPELVVNAQIPEQKPAIVNVGARKTKTRVTKHDPQGRILEFEREEI